MDNKRRKFLKMAGATVLAGISAPAWSSCLQILRRPQGKGSMLLPPLLTSPAAHGEPQPSGVRWAWSSICASSTRTSRCSIKRSLPAQGAQCSADSRTGKVRSSGSGRPVSAILSRAFPESALPDRHENQFPALCNHCDNPSCVKACPTKATFVNEKNGIVAMDFHRCIGCRFCMAACPYGARSFNWQDPRPFIKAYNPDFPTRMRGVVEKCNFCGERLALGLEPACVEACKGTGAMVFGDLNDPHSEIRKVLDQGVHHSA
jgi:Fe-S-cluster-containing dehydrogenase component